MKYFFAIVAAFFSFSGFAEPPRKTSVAGISLREPAISIIQKLEQRYPGCEAIKSQYLADESGSKPIADITINSYISRDEESCTASQASSGRVDRWNISFVHSTVDAASPAYRIKLSRWIKYRGGSLKLRADELLAQFVDEYGQPTLIRYSTRPAAGTARERAMNSWYTVEIFWQKAMQKKGQILCERSICGDTSLKIELSGEGRRGLASKSAPVDHVDFVFEDAELDHQQISWAVDMDTKSIKAAREF